ncbi:hypothetical protein I6F48_18295 [Pseudoalteromonas sp. SWYJ118]|nr:hypothetical protein [Pseudoalteromonas sp. SWYJ118]
MEKKEHRILYAYFSDVWKYGEYSKEQLKPLSEEVAPEEFSQLMKGKVFCPVCATPLSRTPNIDSISKNNITAHFKHGSKKKYPESRSCGWRVNAKPGLNYTNEESAVKAIENKELAIINAWKASPPSDSGTDIDDNGEYNKTAIEDNIGPQTEVPIARHNGPSFSLPSNISTVMALCTNFPENLKRGFFFPNSQYPMLLSDQLYSTKKLTKDLPNKEALFFGKIIKFSHLSYRNVIEVESSNGTLKIYSDKSFDLRKHISFSSKGSYLLFSAKIYLEGGTVFACKLDFWGAYALLPKKYEKYIEVLV